MTTQQRKSCLERLKYLERPTPFPLAVELTQLWIGSAFELTAHPDEGWCIPIEDHQILLERAVRHSAHQLRQQLQSNPDLPHAQLKARASHQIRMVLRCAIADHRGNRYPYFYQGQADLLCFASQQVSIPNFTQLLMTHGQLV